MRYIADAVGTLGGLPLFIHCNTISGHSRFALAKVQKITALSREGPPPQLDWPAVPIEFFLNLKTNRC